MTMTPSTKDLLVSALGAVRTTLYVFAFAVAWVLLTVSKLAQYIPDLLLDLRKHWLVLFVKIGVIGDATQNSRLWKKEIKKLKNNEVGAVKVPLRAGWRESMPHSLSDNELQEIKKAMPGFFN